MAMTLIEIAKEMRAWAIARDDIPRLLAEVDRLRDLLRRAMVYVAAQREGEKACGLVPVLQCGFDGHETR